MIVGANDKGHHGCVGIAPLEHQTIAVGEFILVAFRNTCFCSTLSRWLNVALDFQKNLARPQVVFARGALQTIQVL